MKKHACALIIGLNLAFQAFAGDKPNLQQAPMVPPAPENAVPAAPAAQAKPATAGR